MSFNARTLIEQSLAAIESGNHDVLETCLHPEVIYRRPGQSILSGREAVIDYYRRHRSAKTSQILLDELVCEGDRAVAMGLVEGRGHDGAPIHERFADAYRKMFSSILPDEEKEIVNWKMEARGPLPFRHGAFAYESLSGRKGVPIKGHRPMYLPEQGCMVPVPVYDRYALHPGAAFVGPALVEEQESTVVIAGGDTVEIDDHFNMIVTIYMEEDSK